MKVAAILVSIVLFFFFACSKKSSKENGDSDQSVPSIKIADVIFKRQNSSNNCRFYVDLSTTSTKTVTIDFTTLAGTALANTDFISQSGTLTFAPGKKELYIDVAITGDSLRQPDQNFFIQLSNPQNCTLDIAKATATIINDGTYLPTDTIGYTTPAAYPGYSLAWSDEFDGNTLNTQNWNYETGGAGWGNNELEYYTARPQNVFVSTGNLVIEARQETYNGNEYTSARLTTSGKQQFQYGRIDIRAKLPVAKGLWPALWMLGSDYSQVGWPACGEIDIMELIGNYPGRVYGTAHWASLSGTDVTNGGNYNLSSTTDFSKQFHVFSIVWEQDSIKWYVDDHLYLTHTVADVGTANYPFNATQFFIFNVAVGGNWPGSPDTTTVFPQRMFVDYVRVFQ